MFMEQKFSVLFYINEKSTPAWLKRSIESVLSNTICPTEIIAVVFGKISQEAQQIIDEAKARTNFRVFSYSIGYGRAAALQIAFSKCSNELVALQDVDSISLPTRFEAQLAYFSKHPETAVLGSWCQEMDNDSLLPIAVCEVPEKEEEIKVVLKRSAPFICRTVMLKKSVAEDVGGYKTFPIFENEYLWTRILGKGYKTANLTSPLVQARAYGYPEVRAWSYFRMKKELFYEMRLMGVINRFTYYCKVCNCFIRYMLLANGLSNLFHHERLIADQ